VSQGYFCCVTPTFGGTTIESCKPPGSTCWGHTLESAHTCD
jgi:hypothetical protein